jgi:hypothetical protein
MVFLKISLGIFFLRILIDRWQRLVVNYVVGLAGGFGFAYFFFSVFQCGVPSSTNGATFWEKELSNECASSTPVVLALAYAYAVITATSDVCLALLPIPVLKKARIKKREKLVVCAILLLAVV